jgi:hypothetical protein
MSAPRDQREVQQLVSDCSDEPLGEGVGPGGADRRENHPGILGCEHLVERACELGVAVTDQEPTLSSRPSIARLRACWATHRASGFGVTPTIRTRLVPTSIKNST